MSNSLGDDFYDDNITQLYDYYDFPMNDSIPSNISGASINIRSVRSDSSSSVNPAEASSVTETPTEKKKLPSWAFPTLPTITAEKNTDQRIVGGDEAIPGEIPWQVL